MKKQGIDAVLSIRLPSALAQRLQRDAETRGATISMVARHAIEQGLQPLGTSLTYGLSGAEDGFTLRLLLFGIIPSAAVTGGSGDVRTRLDVKGAG